MAHLRLRAYSSVVLFLVLTSQRELVPADLLLKIVVGSPTGQNKFALNDSAVKLVAALHASVLNLRTLLASGTFREPDVANVVAALAIVKLKNWLGLCDKYLAAMKLHVVSSFWAIFSKEVDALKALCPQWASWLTDEKYSAKELEAFTSELKHDKIKAGIVIVHNGVMLATSLLFGVVWPEGRNHETIAKAFTSAKDAIAYAKQALAIRAAGQLLCNKVEIKPDSTANLTKQVKSPSTSLSLRAFRMQLRSCEDLPCQCSST
jgi:hypothetical protein